ncbi:MAG: hypothetical protein M1826_003507 [Phylliscum demangeonii]|nr:MAG: hypothetical protein M1826_003507 [Phylliscum demangeonii]
MAQTAVTMESAVFQAATLSLSPYARDTPDRETDLNLEYARARLYPSPPAAAAAAAAALSTASPPTASEARTLIHTTPPTPPTTTTTTAAAAIAPVDPAPPPSPHLLIASPYASLPHLLDLHRLSPHQQLLAQSLTTMTATRPDYATCAYPDAFNWAAIIQRLQHLHLLQQPHLSWPGQAFYIVVFRSRLAPRANRAHLRRLDQAAHAEAMRSGGLLKYWFGSADDDDGRNLATCIWCGAEDVKRALGGEAHRRAAQATRGLYLEWMIERWKLSVAEGVAGWELGPW